MPAETDGERGAGGGVGVAGLGRCFRRLGHAAQVLREPPHQSVQRRRQADRGLARDVPHGEPALRPRGRQPQPVSRTHAQGREGYR